MKYRDWDILLEKKAIKNVYLSISPEGLIRLRVPKYYTEKMILDFLDERVEWLSEKTKLRPVKSPMRWEDGDVIPVLGRYYQLQKMNQRGVTIKENHILINEAEPEEMEAALNQFYRKTLQSYLDERVPQFNQVMGMDVKEWRIKAMRTRWGTCNPKAKRVWFSLELAKKEPELIDYVIAHELAHLHEAGHNDRFNNKLAEVMPRWKALRARLNGRLFG